MHNMSKHYYIDSENVGDIWVTLLNVSDDSDEIVVFYTQNSPHMNYKNLILLMNSSRPIKFIECFEGNNGLDFQLCTELGYNLRTSEGEEFRIISNDQGYDAVVRYWTKRGFQVSRLGGKACLALSPRNNKPNRAPENAVTATRKPAENLQPAAPADPEPQAPVTETAAPESPLTEPELPVPEPVSEQVTEAAEASAMTETPAPEAEAETAAPEAEAERDETRTFADSKPAAKKAESAPKAPAKKAEPAPKAPAKKAEPAPKTSAKKAEPAPKAPAKSENEMVSLPCAPEETAEEYAKEILYCVGREDLADLHEALIQIYGDKTGLAFYNSFKADSSYKSFMEEHQAFSREEKIALYCRIVFLRARIQEMPEEFPRFLVDSWMKKRNLNSLRAALQSRYGKDRSGEYYSLMKPHVKILEKIK